MSRRRAHPSHHQYQRTLAELRETLAARDHLKQQLAALEHSVESDERVKEQTLQLKEATTKRSKLEAQLVALNEESAVYRQRVEQLERGAAPAVSSSQNNKDKEQEDLIKELQSKFEVLESVSRRSAFARRGVALTTGRFRRSVRSSRGSCVVVASRL